MKIIWGGGWAEMGPGAVGYGMGWMGWLAGWLASGPANPSQEGSQAAAMARGPSHQLAACPSKYSVAHGSFQIK